MSLRPKDKLAASGGRLDHVLKVGMAEIGGRRRTPVRHWMDKRMTAKKLTDIMKRDLEKKVPESMFKAYVEDLVVAPTKPGVPPAKISLTLDTGLLLTAVIVIPKNFQISVTVKSEDYAEVETSDTAVYSALPTGIQYKTFVDVIMSSITGMVEAMLLSVAKKRK
jgi:hypothetical protein